MEFLCNFDVREILGKGRCSEIKRCIDKRTKIDYAVKEICYQNMKEKTTVTTEAEVRQS